MSKKEINKQEQELQRLDRQLIELLERRFALTDHIAELPPEGPEGLRSWLDSLTDRERLTVPDSLLRTLFREVRAAAAARRQPRRIAYLGPPATFTHQAARLYFGADVEYAAQATIGEVFTAVSRQSCHFGVVPVENSTEGAVTHTLDMFVDTDLKIRAEINMAIHHCLLCRGERDDLQTIYSHPQVLGQCRAWLRRHLPKAHLVEVSSTTEAAARCSRELRSGALAGELAARQYNLPVAERNIEDFSGNTTRFLVLGRELTKPSGEDKTSLLLVVRDRVGALYDALLPFGRHGVNLTFIESRPSKRRNWEYYFFIDLGGHVEDEAVRRTLDELREHCELVKVLGSYPRGETEEQ